MFSDMQQKYNALRDERDEMRRAADRYRDELYYKKDELKGASKLLVGCQKSQAVAENERDRADRDAERARAELE